MDYNDEIHSDDWHTKEIPNSPISIKVISAKEANTKTIEVINNCITKELDEIMSKIYNEIKEGHFCYGDSGCLYGVTKERLKELGYKVEIGSQYNEPYYTIKWGDV